MPPSLNWPPRTSTVWYCKRLSSAEMASDSVPVCSICNSPPPDSSTLLNPLTLLVSVAAFPEPSMVGGLKSTLQPETDKAIAAGINRLRSFMVYWILSLLGLSAPRATASSPSAYHSGTAAAEWRADVGDSASAIG